MQPGHFLATQGDDVVYLVALPCGGRQVRRCPVDPPDVRSMLRCQPWRGSLELVGAVRGITRCAFLGVGRVPSGLPCSLLLWVRVPVPGSTCCGRGPIFAPVGYLLLRPARFAVMPSVVSVLSKLRYRLLRATYTADSGLCHWYLVPCAKYCDHCITSLCPCGAFDPPRYRYSVLSPRLGDPGSFGPCRPGTWCLVRRTATRSGIPAESRITRHVAQSSVGSRHTVSSQVEASQ
jgi:hypothetical protein